MTCCANQRNSHGSFQPLATVAPRRSRFGRVCFEYVGPTGLTARGRITGEIYRFGETGARVAVDTRDAQTLKNVPQLKRMESCE